MPDPAPPSVPEFSEDSFLEMAAASSAPAPEPAPAAPVAAGAPAAPVQVIELEAPPGPGSALPPAAPAPAAPAAGAEPPPAPAPAASADPTALNPDLARNFRIQAHDAIEQRTLQLRAQDRSLTLAQALERAHQELGLPSPYAPPPAAPAAPAAPEPAPQPPVDPLAQIEADIATREAALEDLNPALDGDEWKRVNTELRRLERQAATLAAERAAQAQLEQVTAQQTIEQIEQRLHSEYNVLDDPAHPFTIAFEQRRAQVYQTGTDEQLSDPNLELNLAREIEQHFQTRYGMAVRQPPSSPAATTPQAPTPTVTQPPAPPAAAPVPAAPPRSAAAPLSGAPASVSPVTGIIPPNPLAQVQQTLQSAQQGLANVDDFGDALLQAAYGGQGAPAVNAFGIRMAA